MHSIGVDLGGTHLRVALYSDLIDGADHALDARQSSVSEALAPLAVRREKVEVLGAPGPVVGTLERLVGEVLEEAGCDEATVPLGVGVAGMLRGRDGFVVRAPQLDWTDVPFGALLTERLGPRHPIRAVNDVNAVTYGEFAVGAGVGVRELLAVYVGTGVGGGLVSNGRLVEGASGCAGEIGHFKVVTDPTAELCGCGGRGCVEAYVGGRPLARRLRSDVERGASPRVKELAGGSEGVRASHVDQAAAEGDPYASVLWDDLARYLGSALSNAVALVNPERLVLGGGLLSRTPLLRRRTVDVLMEMGIPAAIAALSVCEAALGDDAGMVGAALLAATGD